MIVRNLFVAAAGVAGVGLMVFMVGCLTDQAAPVAVKNNPLGPNAGCYVCHMTYVKEPLSKVHLKHKVYCVDCHGASVGHANDEDIGATKPDIYFKRSQVNGSCGKCHSGHDAAPGKVIERWFAKKLKTREPVCTDCHGTHRIKRDKPASKPAGK